MHYKTLFQETGVFEENAYQRVVMAIRIGDPRQIYVINSIDHEKVPFFNYELLREHLTNLAYIEQNDGKLVLVTTFKEGKALHQFLSEEQPTEALRSSLAEQYLVHLQHYDALPLPLQYLLADNPQFIVSNQQLIANELLILDRKLPVHLEFAKVAEQVSHTLSMLLPNTHKIMRTLLSADLATFNTLTSFAQHLLYTESPYEGQFETLENSDTPHMDTLEPERLSEIERSDEPENSSEMELSNDSEHSSEPVIEGIILDTLTVKEKETPAPLHLPKKSRKFNPAMIVVTLAAVILAIVLGTGRILDAIQAPQPLADFSIGVSENTIVLTDHSKVLTQNKSNAIYEWQWTGTMNKQSIFTSTQQNPIVPIQESGTYTFTLKVKDSNKWSEPKTQSFDVISVNGKWSARPETSPATTGTPAVADNEELLSPDWIKQLSPTISWDQSQFNSGKQSLKIDLTAPHSKGILELSPSELHRLSDMSFYLFTNDTIDLHVNIEAVKNGKVIAVEALDYTPEASGLWNLVDWTVDPKNFDASKADTLRLTFTSNHPSTLWVDDFGFGTYK